MQEKEVVLKIEHLAKQYRLGSIGSGTLKGDLQNWWETLTKKSKPSAQTENPRFLALDDVSLTIYKGDTLGILGSNGAGKTTLLKIISQITTPTEGAVYINGRVSSLIGTGIGFHSDLTGRENIYLNGCILGMRKKEIDEKLESIIEFSECARFIDTPVKRYSAGMFLRVAFAVAAHLDSEIIITDEILAMGDVRFQKKCLAKLHALAATDNRTVLYVSHQMDTIRALCNRCIVLSHGQLVYDGLVEPALALYQNIASYKICEGEFK